MPTANISSHPTHDPAIESRRAAMAVLAGTDAGTISQGLAAIGDLPEHHALRRPESGLVMVRGRIGGDGAPFNLGEASVSRAAVRLASGETGFGYALGRDVEKAWLIALCDALLQSNEYRDAVEERVLRPARSASDEARSRMRARTAATKVEFFTLVRGED